MTKIPLTKPTLILLYGFPGSGKTFFARQLTESFQAAHVQDDRIRHELFEKPRYDSQENEVITHLMDYMTEEFLDAGISVVYDTNALRLSQRRDLREVARRAKAKTLLVWVQIDVDSAFNRLSRRDRRKSDDKYAQPIDRAKFEAIAKHMQNPAPTEDYVVISGKHTFKTQRHMVTKKLYDMGLINPNLKESRVAMPGLVNLIPNPQGGRVDNSRRNIVIR